MSLSKQVFSGSHTGDKKEICGGLTDQLENANFSQSKLATRRRQNHQARETAVTMATLLHRYESRMTDLLGGRRGSLERDAMPWLATSCA